MTEILISYTTVLKDVLTPTFGEHIRSTNIWFWIAVIQFIIILCFMYIFISKQRKTPQQQNKEESLKKEIDFGNIIKSSFDTGDLYKKLKIKCHPDRFTTNSKLNTIANEIFQEIEKNETNIKRLQELKKEAEKKLSIMIDH